jgi:PilZ domain-containing protein/AMIN domain-containing protein
MSHIEHDDSGARPNDTALKPVPFKDVAQRTPAAEREGRPLPHVSASAASIHLVPRGREGGRGSPDLDRRRSVRIPVFGPVRMGPPSGQPYAVVSATNLSRNGLFIDADRPVRVGARFSAEIPLRTGGTIYVPEAEVAYNRDRVNGSGFGVRFIDPPADVVACLDREISDTEKPSRVSEPPPSDPSILETRDVPKEEQEETMKTEIVKLDDRGKRQDLYLDVTRIPEPIIPDDLGYESLVSPIHTRRPTKTEWMKSTLEDLMHRARAARRDMMDGARRFPILWISAGLLGMVTVLGAGGLAVYQGTESRAADRPPDPKDRGFSAATHQALMGERKMGSFMVESSPHPAVAIDDAKEEAKKPLPPLVIVDDAAKSMGSLIHVETDEVPPGSRAAKTPTKPEANKPEAPLKPGKEKQKVAEKAPKKAADRIDPKAEAERLARKAVERAALISERAKAMLTSSVGAAKALKGSKITKMTKLKLDLGSGRAQVLKTHVFRSPDRFVVDLTGLEGPPALPAAEGHVKQIRFGKHPEFARLVIETDAAIEAGRVSKSGQNLAVTIDYRE